MRKDPVRLPLIAATVLLLVGVPSLAVVLIWLRLRVKRKALEAFYWAAQKSFTAAGATPLGEGRYRWPDGSGAKMELHVNPLFSRALTVRLAAWSDTIHEFELRRGRAVPEEFKAFAPLLERWDTAGKMFMECYVAGTTERAELADDLRALGGIAKIPMSKPYRGGTLTYREGFEPKVPQWHWRHDQRPKLPRDVRRWCFSYWTDGPLLNPVTARILYDLAGDAHTYFLSDTEDLSFLEMGFPRREIACWGTIVELKKPDLLVAADLHTDGEFFGGLLAAKQLPPGFEDERLPRSRFHDEAIRVLRKCDFYARRLFDDENSWYSGEIEVVSAYPLDVRGAVDRAAKDLGAQVMEIDRRFHKRLVKPLDW